MKQNNYLALQCLKCRMISIFPANTADGSTCLSCKGYTVPIGYAMIKNRKENNTAVSLSVDSTELDQAIMKAEKLEATLSKINEIKV